MTVTLTDRLTVAVCDLVAAATGEPCPDPFRATARRLIAAELANTETRTTYSTGATASSAGTVTVAPRVMADALANLDAATIRPTPIVPARIPAGAPIVMPRRGKGRLPPLQARLDAAGPLEVRRLTREHGSTRKAILQLAGRTTIAGHETQQAKAWCATHNVPWEKAPTGRPRATPPPAPVVAEDDDLHVDCDIVDDEEAVEEIILTPFPLADKDTPPPRPTVVPDPPVVAQARVENGHGNVFGCSDCLFIAGRLDELGRHISAKHHRQVANIERRPLDADEIAERVAEADRLVAERVS
jgi:hypothetical protein